MVGVRSRHWSLIQLVVYEEYSYAAVGHFKLTSVAAALAHVNSPCARSKRPRGEKTSSTISENVQVSEIPFAVFTVEPATTLGRVPLGTSRGGVDRGESRPLAYVFSDCHQ